MKKSEKTKIKIERIGKIKRNLAFNKSVLKKNLACARSDSKFKEGYRLAAKIDLYNIHSNLFTLRAVEKQIPMPVRINTRISKTFPIWICDGQIMLNITFEARCANCDKRIETGSKFPAMFTEGHSKYCPYCGQKLWWPKQ